MSHSSLLIVVSFVLHHFPSEPMIDRTLILMKKVPIEDVHVLLVKCSTYGERKMNDKDRVMVKMIVAKYHLL
jgi:hypothetical protein